MGHMPVQVDVDAAVLCKQFVQQDSGLVEPLQVRIEAASPGISVRLLLDDARLFDERAIIVLLVSGSRERWR